MTSSHSDNRHTALYVGIDLGTSGCRATAINADATVLYTASTELPPAMAEGIARYQDPGLWWQAVERVLDELFEQVDPAQVERIAVDGTSGSVLVTNAAGEPLREALLYNDQRDPVYVEHLKAMAPPDNPVLSPNSGLVKLLWLSMHVDKSALAHCLHQADWIAGKLTDRYGISDVNNCLKTGFNAEHYTWPRWMDTLPLDNAWLPTVQAPGAPVGPISDHMAKRFNLSEKTLIVSGTTDSTASFIATGAGEPGDAVTVLGSTLVLKVLGNKPILAANYGVYSQPLGDLWLVGGASNSGGAVLKHYFTDEQLQAMTTQLDPQQPTGLNYYPLPALGERFPINDPNLSPQLEPRPDDDVTFFQGMLEGIARIEKQGYERLAELGAPFPKRILSAGGGSVNDAWTQIRQSLLGIPVETAPNTEAAYGSALIALRSDKS
ncbi:FGGY-family carbohydrate kinase [Thiohalophilus sp.]|uniref:FGGY-family carbohydrate kinase n=1 Tax=Thiohalophilus sp. TaxID=3028392 RepID=UPI002ACED4BD|nr:FGGY-family carbohydrate kinase [Thiohalophilus sp.]MDZ7804645.1 FGGY-family carbohydrate kinase [Thiohalophilus sp.]